MSDALGSGPAGCVLVASLGAVRGLKGEIYASGAYPPASYLALGDVWLERDGQRLNEGRPLQISQAWAYKDGLVFRFAGLDTIEAVEPLAHSSVVVPGESRPALAEGEFYLADLVGCTVFDRRSGLALGTVTGWQQCGGPELLEVEPAGAAEAEPFWIPFARTICVEIDPAGRRIVIDPPEGLLDLNREGGAG